MQPVITALIPSKNRPDLVNRLVESIRAQKLIEALEIIVVDDGSTVPLELADPDVLLVRNEKSLGACAARNRGFAAARGEFIILFDDDTQLCDPMMLQGAVDLARRHPEVGAIGFRQLMSNGVQAECQPADSCETCETSCFFGYGALLRRAAILQTRGFEESFVYNYEEQDLCMQLHQAGWRVLYAPELALLHHHDPRGARLDEDSSPDQPQCDPLDAASISDFLGASLRGGEVALVLC
jgi:GT2 family glycosyltransferase